MHEVSLVSEIVDHVTSLQKREGFAKVTEIFLSIGDLSGVDAGAIEFCFPDLTIGTSLQGAHLVIQRVPIEARCDKCDLAFTPPERFWLICPSCGRGENIEIARGKDFTIDKIVYEKNDDFHLPGAC